MGSTGLPALYDLFLSHQLDEAYRVIQHEWKPEDPDFLHYIWGMMDQYLDLSRQQSYLQSQTKELLQLYDSIVTLLNESRWDTTRRLFQSVSWSFAEFLCIHNRITFSEESLYFLLHQPDDWFKSPANALDLIDLHPPYCFTSGVVESIIILGNAEALQTCMSKMVKFQENYLFIFARSYLSLCASHPKTRIYDIAYLLFCPWLLKPIWTTSYKQMSMVDKKHGVLEAMFQTQDPDMVEYALRFFFYYQDPAIDAEIMEELHDQTPLAWDDFTHHKFVFRRAQLYPISSSKRHLCMGQLLMWYVGNDPDLTEMAIQCYKEHKSQKHIEPIEEFEL